MQFKLWGYTLRFVQAMNYILGLGHDWPMTSGVSIDTKGSFFGLPVDCEQWLRVDVEGQWFSLSNCSQWARSTYEVFQACQTLSLMAGRPARPFQVIWSDHTKMLRQPQRNFCKLTFQAFLEMIVTCQAAWLCFEAPWFLIMIYNDASLCHDLIDSWLLLWPHVTRTVKTAVSSLWIVIPCAGTLQTKYKYVWSNIVLYIYINIYQYIYIYISINRVCIVAHSYYDLLKQILYDVGWFTCKMQRHWLWV